ncbi:YceI family protein [Noviluteimonas gilva]|uniref:Polyisoprenoid-binding protein n=1 Tax=Noviluteimonas gilva TaxID=2682097 RepID=A0A7C9LZ23_9GAMM|nr:YceI family protein [Lysobacter gilvus]MUV12688.1 polyisoprenoid-binding protein [Lysobacter gilvus]
MSHRFARHAAVLALLLASVGAHAAETVYALDPVHTRVMFAVSHAGFSNPMGTVSGTTGTLVFDPDDWASARVEAKIPMTRLDLGDKKWNDAVLDRTFLDVKKHPDATFVSTRVEPVDATHAKVFGNLTLHGVTREVQLDVVFHQAKRHPMPPFRRTAGFSATGTLSRKAFAITSWPSVVGDAVEIRIEAEGTRTRDDASGVAAPTTQAAPPAASTQAMPPEPSTQVMPAGTSTVAPASNATTTP